MSRVLSSPVHESRLRPLAACVISIFALSAPATTFAANTWPVTSCADSGPGTLRDVVGAVTTLTGDTVSLTGLVGLNACPSSKISLSTGEIFVQQDSLTILGPGASVLAVDGTNEPGGPSGLYNSRVFTHKGTGTLTINSLSVTGGHVYHNGYPALGGCIYSKANVTLKYSTVSGCSAMTTGSYNAFGGGVYTKAGLTAKYSTVSGNTISGPSTTEGGGATVGGDLVALYTTIEGNHATGPSLVTFGGGLHVSGSVTLGGTTISGNTSSGGYGGIDAFSLTPGSLTFTMGNSTISGNSAAGSVGALYANSATIKLYNSTIAFNSAKNFPGVELSASESSIDLTLQSTLISNNTYPSAAENDLDISIGVGHTITINGGDPSVAANNLIRVTFASGLPNDTKIFGACPLLGPLRNNGGLTKTHALLSHSVAIDAGNNVSGGTGINFDQRGQGTHNKDKDYPRVSGPTGDPNPLPDIGAYEVQQDDVLFNSGFDGCPDLPI